MVILNRTLKFEADGREIDVPIRIHQPIDRGDHWQCEYEIGWPDAARKSQAGGIDAIQSLLMAMQKNSAEIYTSDAHRSGKPKWHDPSGGYGFPLPPGICDLQEGDDSSM